MLAAPTGHPAVQTAPAPVVRPEVAAQSLYQEIADNARLATGARYVHFSWYDRDTNFLRVGAMSSTETAFMQRGMGMIRGMFPGWDPEQVACRVDVNPALAAVFVEGRSVHVPLKEIVQGTVHPMIARIAGLVVGMRWCFSCPVTVRGEVAGSLALHGPDRFSEAQTRSCEAFGRMAAVAIENARLLEQVRGHVTELKRTQRLIAAAEDRQRQEIAEALHGRVQSSLLALATRLEDGESRWPDAPRDLLDLVARTRVELDRIREEEVRRASHALHPSIIELGLVPALRSLAARAPVRVEVHAAPEAAALDDPLVNRIPRAVRLAAYRVAEEAIANAHRHGGARHVHVALRLEAPDRLRLDVRDDGRGFDPARRVEGLGSRAIASRVGHVGGEWRIESTPGEGALVTCVLPLRVEPL